MKPASQQKLVDVVNQMPKSVFTFEELRQAASGDYESIREELFALLDHEGSCVEQFFDEDAEAMKLRRVRS